MTPPTATTNAPEADTGAKPRERRRTMTINLGPQHPATHGTLRQILELDGEIVVRCTPEIGFLHTGFEKLGEYMTFNQFVTVTDRMNYLSPMANNFGWVSAVEEALGIELTERGKWSRTMLAELSRLADHIASIGLQAMDLGAFSVMLWGWIQREKLYVIFEWVTGIRLTSGFARVGGQMQDLPADFCSRVSEWLDGMPDTLNDIEKMLNRNRIFIERTQGVGHCPKETLLEYGVTGPILRAGGVAYDVRRAAPYWVYDELDFDVVTHEDSDVWARYRVRMAEVRESMKILRQCIEKLPQADGPVNVDNHKVGLPPKGEEGRFFKRPTNMEDLIMHFKQVMDSSKIGSHGIENDAGVEYYSSTETGNGELGWHIIMRGDGRPHRIRVRPPSLHSYQAFPAMVEGGLLSDLVATMSSMNIIAGELDR